jgi:hypothetical protein
MCRKYLALLGKTLAFLLAFLFLTGETPKETPKNTRAGALHVVKIGVIIGVISD